jgi:hypothetical protein
VEGTSQAILGSSDQRNVPASVSLFLKSENIPALLYVRKGLEYTPFHDLRSSSSSNNEIRAVLGRVLIEQNPSFKSNSSKKQNKIPSFGSKNQTPFQSGSWTKTGS